MNQKPKKVERNTFQQEIVDLPIKECYNNGRVVFILLKFDDVFMNRRGVFFKYYNLLQKCVEISILLLHLQKFVNSKTFKK